MKLELTLLATIGTFVLVAAVPKKTDLSDLNTPIANDLDSATGDLTNHRQKKQYESYYPYYYYNGKYYLNPYYYDQTQQQQQQQQPNYVDNNSHRRNPRPTRSVFPSKIPQRYTMWELSKRRRRRSIENFLKNNNQVNVKKIVKRSAIAVGENVYDDYPELAEHKKAIKVESHYTAWDLSKRRKRRDLLLKKIREKRNTLNSEKKSDNNVDLEESQQNYPHYTAWDLSKRRKRLTNVDRLRVKRQTGNNGVQSADDDDNIRNLGQFLKSQYPHYTAWDLSKRRKRHVIMKRQKRQVISNDKKSDADLEEPQEENYPQYTAWDLSKRRKRFPDNNESVRVKRETGNNGVQSSDYDDSVGNQGQSQKSQYPHYTAWDLSKK